jgi:ribokinase
VLIPNLGEAEQLSGRSGADAAAQALAAWTGGPVVVTLGKDGALVLDDGRVARVPGYSVKSVDATGAGDTVAGVVAAELARAKPLVDAVRTAMAAAAVSVTRPGAREGMPDRSTVEAFVASKAPGIRSGHPPRG